MNEFATLTVLPGLGLLILSTSNRFIHLTTRAERTQQDAPSRALLIKRIRMLHAAMVSLYLSVCLIVFSNLVSRTVEFGHDWVFTAGVATLVVALQWLVRESFQATTVACSPDNEKTPPA